MMPSAPVCRSTRAAFSGGGDVAVGDHRNFHLLLDGGDGVVFGVALKQIGARAPVHRQRLDAAIFGETRNGDAVLVRAVPAGADLERDRHVHGADHGGPGFRKPVFILHQRRARKHVADFLRRAAHVDVDDLRAALDVDRAASRHQRRVAADDLHCARLVLAGVIGAARVFSLPQSSELDETISDAAMPAPRRRQSMRNGRSVTPAMGARKRLFRSW